MDKRGDAILYEPTIWEIDGCTIKSTPLTFRNGTFPPQMTMVLSPVCCMSIFLLFVSCRMTVWVLMRPTISR